MKIGRDDGRSPTASSHFIDTKDKNYRVNRQTPKASKIGSVNRTGDEDDEMDMVGERANGINSTTQKTRVRHRTKNKPPLIQNNIKRGIKDPNYSNSTKLKNHNVTGDS